MSTWGVTARALVGVIAAFVAAASLSPVHADQPPLVVGVDAAPWAVEPSHPQPPESPGPTRPSVDDRPDADPTSNQTHVVYFVPKDKQDRELDTNGTLGDAIDAIRSWFARETSREGASARRPRFDKLPAGLGGGWDVTFVRGDENAAAYESLGDLVAELTRKGHDAPNKRYLVFAEIARGSRCGEGYFPLPAPGLDNGRYAAIYLQSNPACGSNDFGRNDGSIAGAGRAETIAVQEWLHNEAIVQPTSPHHCPTQPFHVCTGPLVYAPDNLDPEHLDAAYPFVTGPLGDKVLDRGRDDYLDHPWPHLADLRDSSWLE